MSLTFDQSGDCQKCKKSPLCVGWWRKDVEENKATCVKRFDRGYITNLHREEREVRNYSFEEDNFGPY